MNFYPFHIGDYLSHTSHLTDEEDLAYRRMIDLYYQTEEPFTDTSKLARKVRSSFEIVGSILSEFFVYQENAWHLKRADEEIAKYKAMKDGGRKGASIRWHKGSDSPPITPLKHPLMPTKNQEPRTKNQLNTKTPEGVSDLVWNDFRKLREKHKAPITETALKGLKREAEKAKLSLEDVMALCCERGWRGFKADWAIQEEKPKDLPLGTNEQIEAAYRQELGKDPALARFGNYFEMRTYIVEQREKRKLT